MLLSLAFFGLVCGAPFPLILDDSPSDSFSVVNWDWMGHQYIVWGINGPSSLTLKFASAADGFSTVNIIGSFPKNIFEGDFLFFNNSKTGSTWLFFATVNGTTYHTCDLGLKCQKVYDATPGRIRPYISTVDSDIGRFFFSTHDGQQTTCLTADFDGSNVYQVLQVPGDMGLEGTMISEAKSAELNALISGVNEDEWVTSLAAGAPAVRLGVAASNDDFQMIGAMLIGTVYMMCGYEMGDSSTEVACYSLTKSPVRTSICTVDKKVFFGASLNPRFVVGWTESDLNDDVSWAFYKCDLFWTKSQPAILAAQGPGHFTTDQAVPVSVTIRGTTTMMSLAINGTGPQQGNALLIRYDADPSKADVGIVGVVPFNLGQDIEVVYGSLLEMKPSLGIWPLRRSGLLRSM